MTERPVGVTDVAAGAGVAEFRTRERTVGATAVCEQYLIYENERVASFKGTAVSLIIKPTAVTDVPFFTVWNGSASVKVAVRSLLMQVDYPTNSATTRWLRSSWLTAAPTGGVALVKVPFDSAQSSDAAVVIRAAQAATDDGYAAITATPVGGYAWRQGQQHAQSAVDQYRDLDDSFLPDLADRDPVILAQNEGLVITLVDLASTSARFVFSCMFEEFTLP